METLPEYKEEHRKPKDSHSILTSANCNDANIGALIKCEDFNSKERLLRVTAHILKFIQLLKRGARRAVTDTPQQSLLLMNYEGLKFYG